MSGKGDSAGRPGRDKAALSRATHVGWDVVGPKPQTPEDASDPLSTAEPDSLAIVNGSDLG